MQPIFILGYSKSGTSLLTSLLDGHPEINVIPEESDYFDGMYFLVESLKAKKISKEEKINHILSSFITSTHIANLFKGKRESDPRGNFDYTHFDKEAFKLNFKEHLQQSEINHDSVFSALAIAYCAGINSKADKKYWLEKTPYHIINVENRKGLLDEIFGEYKVIHIFRDPRDNFLSYRKKRPELNLNDMCAEWNRVVSVARSWNDDSNNLIIHYEDLLQTPNSIMNNIMKFLNLKENEIIYQPTKNGINWLGNSMFGTKSKGIDSSRINRYKELMPSADQSLIESACYENMTALGYECENSQSKISLGYLIAKANLKFKTQKSKYAFKLASVLK